MKINYFEKFVDNKVFIKIKNQDEKELFLEICSGKGLTFSGTKGAEDFVKCSHYPMYAFYTRFCGIAYTERATSHDIMPAISINQLDLNIKENNRKIIGYEIEEPQHTFDKKGMFIKVDDTRTLGNGLIYVKAMDFYRTNADKIDDPEDVITILGEGALNEWIYNVHYLKPEVRNEKSNEK